jgi:hypothetical protein
MKNYRFTDFTWGYSSETRAFENSSDEDNTKIDAREMG